MYLEINRDETGKNGWKRMWERRHGERNEEIAHTKHSLRGYMEIYYNRNF